MHLKTLPASSNIHMLEEKNVSIFLGIYYSSRDFPGGAQDKVSA